MAARKSYYKQRKKQESFLRIFDTTEESDSGDALFGNNNAEEVGGQVSDLPLGDGSHPVSADSPHNSGSASDASEYREVASSSTSNSSHNGIFSPIEDNTQDAGEHEQEIMQADVQGEGGIEVDVQGEGGIQATGQKERGVQKHSINDSLVGWYNRNNIPHSALKDLLQILKPYFNSLPADPRTLLHTKCYEMEQNGTGHLIYFGIKENLYKHFNFDLSSTEVLKLDVNIDGVPVFKSRNTSFWPILCSFSNSIKYSPNSILPFIVAIFYGESKPEINHYLEKICSEVKSLLQDGIMVNDKHYRVELRSIIADAPARAYLKQIKTHGGYFACDRCCVKGVYKHNAISYEEMKAELRSDASFRERRQPEHHVGRSPFEDLHIDMVNCFSIDYMHLILLGIVRKLINIYLHKIPYKISSIHKDIANKRIKLIRKFFPLDFNRKPRSLNELERFKATEFRSLILYTGAVICKDLLSNKMYENFLTLMYIVRILCDEHLVDDKDMLDYARNLCILFVKQFRKIYKRLNVTYNVHSLIHIVDDVERLCVLDSFSAFPYENCLGNIKSRIRSSKFPLAQISNRISEGYSFHKTDKIKGDGIFINGHKIILQDNKNSCVMLKNCKIAAVEAVTNDRFKIRIYKEKKSAFKFPYDSAFLNIYSVCGTSEASFVAKSEVIRKCMLIPFKKKYIVLPLL